MNFCAYNLHLFNVKLLVLHVQIKTSYFITYSPSQFKS